MGFIRLYEDSSFENEMKNINNFSKMINNESYEYFYFLSHLRHNLFNWYPFKENESILEIGSSYGQLTSFFTQKVNHVVAIEDSESKANIVSNRAKEANVIVCDFDKLNIDEKFDYIVLCNIFEYTKSFYESENPYVNYLKYLKTFLKEEGVILIALSNRLGLKYFAGFKEEHTNQFFAGIDGYSNNVEIFNKSELIKIIENAGFNNYKFFYPYPDHEFPQIINTDKFINKIPYTKKPIYFNLRSNLFDESKLNQTLAKDNLADYFANSFLIEIRNSDNIYETDDIDYVKINTQRKPEFQINTIIHKDSVSKYPMSNKAENHLKKMCEENDNYFGKIKYLNCGDNCSYKFLQEKSLNNLINDSILENDKNTFFKLIQDYFNALVYNSYETDSYASDNFISIFKKKSKEKFHCHVKSNIDLDFNDIFIIDDEYIAIDYEWVFNFPIPIEYIFYRAIKHNLESNPMFNKFTSLTEIFRNLNLNMAHIELFEIWEKNLFNYIYGYVPINNHKIIPKENLDYVENIDEYVDLVLNSKKIDSHNFESLKKDIVLNQRKIINQKNTELKQKDRIIKKKNKEIKKKNKEIKNKNNEINRLINSASWKITKPLRKFNSIFK